MINAQDAPAHAEQDTDDIKQERKPGGTHEGGGEEETKDL
jgi:hypothetical protein